MQETRFPQSLLAAPSSGIISKCYSLQEAKIKTRAREACLTANTQPRHSTQVATGDSSAHPEWARARSRNTFRTKTGIIGLDWA